MMKFRENEDAVSPVIGVILMVAITVILAAVIAAFVFGMADNVSPQKEITVTATQTGDATAPMVTVKLFGGKDVGLLDATTPFKVNVEGKNETVTNLTNKVGSFESYALTPGKQNTVTVVAHFTDGTEQIVLDKVFTVAAAP